MNKYGVTEALAYMSSTQQLAARTLINMIDIISTRSHALSASHKAFSDVAIDLMQQASLNRDPAKLQTLQSEWAKACLTYGQSQSESYLHFVEHCGTQALKVCSDLAENNPDSHAS